MKASIYIAIIFLLLTELVIAKTITNDTNHDKKKDQTKRRLQNQIGVGYDNTDTDNRYNAQGARARTGRREQYESATFITDEDVITDPAEEALTKRAQKKLANQLAREEHSNNARQEGTRTERRKRDNAEVTEVNVMPELTTSSMQMNQRTQKLQSSTTNDIEFITPTASTGSQENGEIVQQSSSKNEKKANKQVSTPIPTYFPTYETYRPTSEMQEGGGGGGGDTVQTSRQNDNQVPTYFPTYSTYICQRLEMKVLVII